MICTPFRIRPVASCSTLLPCATFLGRAFFTSMSKISPTYPTVKLFLVPWWVSCCRWPFFELRLNDIRFHSHLFQFYHDRWDGTGKDCISLCQSFKFVPLHMNSLYYSVQVINHLVMLFWRGWRYTIDVLYRRCLSPLSCGGDRSLLFLKSSMG